MSSIFGKQQDIIFMQKALAQAQRAFKADEVPIGAIVVDQEGKILARAYNQMQKRCTQLAHAEALALQKAGKKRGDWRLNGCWVYVTLQPCAMCMNAILLSRCAGVVYGTESHLFGYHLDKGIPVQIYKSDIVQIVPGVCQSQAIDLLQQFFQKKRKKKGELHEEQ